MATCSQYQVSGARILVRVQTGGTAQSPTYSTIGFQKSCTLSMNEDTIETSNKDTPLWKEYLPGYRDWSVDADAMLVENDAALKSLEDLYLGAAADLDCIWLAIKTPTSDTYWTGKAIIKSLKYSAPDNGVYTAAISLTGTGALTRE